MLLNSRWQYNNILLLSSNNRICSFYWIRESKHCFLTSSNLYRYFLCLVFLDSCNLLDSLHLSWLCGDPISHPVFSYLWFTEYHVVHAPPYSWHTWCVFLKHDTRGNLAQELVLVLFPCSAFLRRLLMQPSIGRSRIIPLLLTWYPRTDTFLCDISLC